MIVSKVLVYEVEKQTEEDIVCGYSSFEIHNAILDKIEDKGQLGTWKSPEKLDEKLKEFIRHIVKDLCDSHPNYKLRQKLRAGKLLVNKESENKGFLVYNPLKLDQFKISHRSLYALLPPEYVPLPSNFAFTASIVKNFPWPAFMNDTPLRNSSNWPV